MLAFVLVEPEVDREKVVIPPSLMVELARQKHQETHWRIDSMFTGFQKHVVSVGMI